MRDNARCDSKELFRKAACFEDRGRTSDAAVFYLRLLTGHPTRADATAAVNRLRVMSIPTDPT